MHALLIPSWYPAKEGDTQGSFFAEQAQALAQGGIKTGVLAPRFVPMYSANPLRTQWKTQFTLEAGVPILRANLPQLVPLGRRVNVAVVGRRLERLFRAYAIKHGMPNVLHAHSLFPGGYVAAYLSKKYGLPYLLTEHRTLDHLPTRTRFGSRIENSIVKGAASRHAVSVGHAVQLQHRFTPASGKWKYTPNLLPPVCVAQPSATTDPGYFSVGHVSVLDKVKGVDILIDAFWETFQGDLSARLMIGGDGAESARLRQKVSQLGADSQIHFMGAIDRDDVPDFNARMDVTVLPSYSETFGITLIESMAAGTPVIATNTWGGRTIVNEQNGVLIPIGDTASLAAALSSMRNSGAYDRTEIRRKTVADFGPQVFVDRYRAAYEDALRAHD